ncbi:DUF2170 family protein [Rhabdochromatium marinum]|uniref:DUF2170 family protein n=1 Tax=Rhabdochromatium marinum TaxID=48729 RepID=UPI00190452AC|nr:DUF2170 family protein [Rhabdochromatium marinum]MBK1648573.1 hypothetical protein [Rhabdochromatium marinum]
MSQRLNQLYEAIQGQTTADGLTLRAEMHSEGAEGLRLWVQDREELPILLTLDDEQILVSTVLWREADIQPERRTELLDVLLTLNLSMPLSSFGKLGDQYLLFGALSVRATDAEILEDITALSDNTLSALDLAADYLYPSR